MSVRRSIDAAFAVAGKDLKVAWSYRLSFIFGNITVLSALILFYFVSRVVGQSPVVGTADEYFRFIVIGMVLAGLIERSVSAAIGSARRDQVEGTLEAMAALPLSPAALGLSWITYPLLNGVVGAVITVLLAIPLGMLDADPNWLTIAVTMLLCISLFASLGLLGASLVIAFQQGAGIVPFFLSFLALISGTLFPVTVMPAWLETISEASPLRHALDALRPAALEGASIADVGTDLAVLAGFLVVFAPLGVASISIALNRARRVGGLSRF